MVSVIASTPTLRVRITMTLTVFSVIFFWKEQKIIKKRPGWPIQIILEVFTETLVNEHANPHNFMINIVFNRKKLKLYQSLSMGGIEKLIFNVTLNINDAHYTKTF